jgi:hypothetical protein
MRRLLWLAGYLLVAALIIGVATTWGSTIFVFFLDKYVAGVVALIAGLLALVSVTTFMLRER